MDFEADPRVAEALARLPETKFEGSAWKHTLPTQPIAAANTRGARWNPPGVPAIYFALERETALAEGDYLVGLQPQPIRGRREIHEVGLRLDRVLDLRDRQQLHRLGASEAELRSSDHSTCRRIGGTAEWLGFDGIIVPSARTSGANLVVFERHAAADFDVRVLASEKLEGES